MAWIKPIVAVFYDQESKLVVLKLFYMYLSTV